MSRNVGRGTHLYIQHSHTHVSSNNPLMPDTEINLFLQIHDV